MAQRGDPLSSTGSYTGGSGSTRGNYSVYSRPSSTSGVDNYNDRSKDAYYHQRSGGNPDWRPSGAGATGQGSNNQGRTPVVVPDNGRGGPSYQQGGGAGYRGGPQESAPSKYSWESISNSMLEFGKKIPIVKIGGLVYEGDLFSSAGEWLGSWSESPWNPMNWESGDPPEWTLELGDGTVLGRGGLENYGGMMTGGGNSRLAVNPQTGKPYDTSNMGRMSDERAEALYGLDIQNPEGMDVPDGSYYDYRTKQIRSYQGDPYAYRAIAASNAWKNAGIDDLKLSDEEYLKLTEEEKQANFEARKASSNDPMNFGDEQYSASPFGNDKIKYNMGIYAPQNDEEENAVLREMFNKGEITEVELDRYLDDAKRNQGEATAQQSEVASRVEFLKNSGGYTDEELAGFVDAFAKEEFATEGFSSPDDYFDSFNSTLNELTDIDPKLQEEMFELYDTKREADYENYYAYLDSLQGTGQFEETYLEADVEKQNSYLEHLYQEGRIDDEQYLSAVASNLAEEGEFVFKLNSGEYAVGTEEGIYGQHRVIELPSDADDSSERYYDYLKNKDYDDVTSIEGASDEFNARRAKIAALDNTGNVSYDSRKALKRPSKSIGDRVKGLAKTVGLNALTGGLYSAVPAGINILKGEGSTDDWLAFGPVAMEATGLVTPPATSEEAAAIQDRITDEAIGRGYSASEAASMGYNAGQSALAGVGLDLGVVQLTYKQTNQIIQAAAAENLQQYVAKEFGVPLLKNKLTESWEEFQKNNMLPIGEPAFVGDWQDAWDSIPEDIQAGLNETFENLAEGEPVDEAIAKGVVEYIQESPLGSWIEDGIKQAGRDFDDEYLQPIKEFAEDVVNVDKAKAFLSNFDDKVLQPAVEPVKEAGSAIDDTLIQPPKEFLEGLFDGTDEDEDKDDILSSIKRSDPLTSKKKSGGGEGMVLGGLFDRELFKFKEKDKLEIEQPEVAERKRYVEGDLFDDPFASTFDDRNLV